MKYIFGACMVIGFLVVLGSAGASDCGMLEFGQVVLRCIGGVFVSLVGLVGLNVLSKREGEK